MSLRRESVYEIGVKRQMLRRGPRTIVLGVLAFSAATQCLKGQASPAGTFAVGKPSTSLPHSTALVTSSGHDALDPAKIKADEHRLMGILSRQPDDAGALAGMGWVRSRQHNFPAAISFLERARQQRPHDHRLAYALDEARFELMMQEGLQSLKANEFETAEARYRAALEIRPHSKEANDGLRAARAAITKSPAGV